MAIITGKMDDGDLGSFESSEGELVHVIRMDENRYAIDTMAFGEFKDKVSLENAKRVLEEEISDYENISVGSDDERSFYLKTEVWIYPEMTDEEEHKILNDASNLLKEAFDGATRFFKLISK